MYPEDSTVEKNDLVRQWMAEGFVRNTHGVDAEDVGGS
jgi:disease resistance protein RPM1